MTHRFQRELTGKSGILTGGTSGFGYEMVKGLVRSGANVAVFSADELPDASRAELLRAGDGKAEYYRKDVTGSNAAEEMVERTVARFGRLDFVVANAGMALRFEEPLLSTPVEKVADTMRRQFDLFPVAFATLAVAAARVMAPVYRAVPCDETGHREDSGAILVTLSETVFSPLRDDLVAYAAAKRACLSVMESLAAILGPVNIRVNGIAPGYANTAAPKKFYDRHPGDPRRYREADPSETVLHAPGLRRPGRPLSAHGQLCYGRGDRARRRVQDRAEAVLPGGRCRNRG